ncbi:TnsA endonuclease N-terminal domain-containing protein [Maridesulfovibrio sp.]|uniref:TnsA endonuclease N-terminal domain-containing protein n=1 Tax=Maridesulfovibrio sp. TaxID=2795000 RepID=UPI002A1875C0|nr:TnsA endonuclease N-terminal domain-containing protein [Maridesulfovibrio sp.]
MARKKYSFDEKKIQRFLDEGRGKGTGADYKPWLTVQDIAANSNTVRPVGWKTGRLHHLLSQLERNYFFYLEWADEVIDIREQYPLLPLEETISIAAERGIRHPCDPHTKVQIPLTTDFFITVERNGKQDYLARTIKPSEKLNNKRVLEKFEIERRYWKSRGIDWGIVTERQISKTVATNIMSLHSKGILGENLKDSLVIDDALERIFVGLQVQHHVNVSALLAEISKGLDMSAGDCRALFYYLVAKKLIRFDLTVDCSKDVPLMAFTPVGGWQEWRDAI